MGKVERIVFLSLVLDLFAFTIPLPLFPRIIEWYTVREISDPNGLLSRTLRFVSALRGIFYKPQQNSQRWDVVFLGGLMGSVFSTLQFLVSPHIGSLSDKYGRRNVLLITMIGNILSALIWIKSTTFASYMLSRVIGGLSEGNVQLATAILSDVSTPANRSKALAHVGIAFAICFCIGPPIGAYFASRPVPPSVGALQMELNIYAAPAILTLVLLVAETLFLIVALPETRNTRPDKHDNVNPVEAPVNEKSKTASIVRSVQERTELLRVLRKLHFLFLGIFSGVEFTLTFLTFDLFDWNNKQNGVLMGSIGIITAALGLVFLAILPHFVSTQPKIAVGLLRAAAVCLAFTSATVVSSLTSYASLQCDEGFDKDTGKPAAGHPELAKGKALGEFRSSGQLGRAIGPLLACASYWTFGPSVTYVVSAIAMLTLSASMKTVTILSGKSS
ncbi:major facilitator superfamily domain-containing protein [Suillus lakei]|nr:major facilitator superfamily domain-containing protein [Suillus lakei]